MTGAEKIFELASSTTTPIALAALGTIGVIYLGAGWLRTHLAKATAAIQSGNNAMLAEVLGRISLDLDQLTTTEKYKLARMDLILHFLLRLVLHGVLCGALFWLLQYFYALAIHPDPQAPRPKQTEVVEPAPPPPGHSTPVPPSRVDPPGPAPEPPPTTTQAQHVPRTSIRDGVGVVDLVYEAAGGGVWTVRVAKTKHAHSPVYDVTGNLDGQDCSNARLDPSTPEASMTCTAPSVGKGHLALMVKPTDTSEFSAVHFPIDVTVTRTP